MAEILEALPNLGGSCPTFSGGNWGKVVLVITFSLLNLLERIFFFDFVCSQPFGLNGAGFRAIGAHFQPV